ncbi:hypothetical protein C8J31_12011 [Rhizobium sp. PP-CC-2G-626]|nr:hypothetical protein C8J31_12011 [Rhizobium sp. PP-CC-2G-626]
MSKLVDDIFIRRLAQIFLLAIGLAISTTCLFFLVFIYQYRVGEITSSVQSTFFNVIAFPFETSLGTFITGLSAIIPSLLSVVCFELQTDLTPPKPSTRLNHIGHAFVLILAVGIALSIISIFIVSSEKPEFFNAFFADSSVAVQQMRALFGAFLAVQGTYLSQLLKDKA